MSEYQYYEFRAVDRPLTDQQMAELRKITSRATITPTSLVNVYHFGDFRGDPLELLERYFDAHVYVANWGTHELMLALPRQALDPKTAELYARGDDFSCVVRGDRVILDFMLSESEPEFDEEGEGWLASLIQLRADLAAGDLRGLYLGWLHCVESERIDEADYEEFEEESEELEERFEDENHEEDEEEPPVPPGLGELSAPLQALADFLEISPDLIEVAAEASGKLQPTKQLSAELGRWVRDLPVEEKDALLVRLAAGEPHLQMELQRRFREAQPRPKLASAPERRRTARALLAAADARAEARQQAEAEERTREETRRAEERARARSAYLDSLVGREERIWKDVESEVNLKQPNAYDRAVQHLLDLRELANRGGDSSDFQARLLDLRARHAKKTRFVERLDQARLRPSDTTTGPLL
jgi:hypothetical protein